MLVHNSGALAGEIPEGLPPTVNQFAHHHMWNPGKPDEETEIEAAARKLLQVEAAASESSDRKKDLAVAMAVCAAVLATC